MKRLLLVATLSMSLPVMAQNVATVNGQPITKDQLDIASKALIAQGAPDNEKTHQVALDALIGREVMVQEATKQGLDKKPEIAQQLNMVRQDILANAVVHEWVLKNPISDADVKKAYDDLVKQMADAKEYKVRHILVKDEKEANNLLAQIKNKKITFAKAAEKSIDPGSAKQGGELGWTNPNGFVPEFATAVKAAKKGELIATPVHTQFGWHIIQVEDTRKVTPPTFDQAKDELKQMLTQERLQKYVEQLRKDSKVDIVK